MATLAGSGNELVANKWFSSLEEGADRIASLLERYRVAALVLATVAYLVVTVGISAWRPFWYDELFTHYIARQPAGEIREALKQGTDQMPLPYYLVVRASQRLFGEGELAARMPSVIGYWLGCLCLFRFVRRRTAALYGFLAIAFALSSSFAYRYAFEARPYALVFGFGALALVCWQSAAENRRRPAALAGLALALLAGVYSHYYAILLVCPIAAGEVVRAFRSRHIDWPLWLALLPCFVPLAFAELGTNLARYGATFWSAPRPSFFIVFYERMLQSLLLPAALLLVILALYYALRIENRQRTNLAQSPPTYEVTAVVALAGLPCFGYAVAVMVTNALVPRYVIAAILGLAILYSWLAFFGPRGKVAGVAALVVLAGATGMNRVLELRSMARERAQAPGLALPDAAVREPGPIVVENPLFFFEASYRSPYRSRLFYLVDPKSAGRYSSTYLDPGLPLLKGIASVNVELFDAFAAKHRRFTVYQRNDVSYGDGWILQHLLAYGARLELKELKGSDRVFVAVLPD